MASTAADHEVTTINDNNDDGDDDQQQMPYIPESKIAHGTFAPNLMEKIVRERVYESLYWKQHCAPIDITAATLMDKCVHHLHYVGGMVGDTQKPCDFLCLVLKLLHLMPGKEIIRVYMEQSEFKYLKAVGMFVWRLIAEPLEVYTALEPMLCQYMKIRRRDFDGSYTLVYLDEFADELLTQERVCGIILPRLTKRDVLEELGQLEPYESPLGEDALAEERPPSDDDDEERQSQSRSRSRSRSVSSSDEDADRRRAKKPRLRSPTTTLSKLAAGDSLSIEETNRLRASIGLPPLRM